MNGFSASAGPLDEEHQDQVPVQVVRRRRDDRQAAERRADVRHQRGRHRALRPLPRLGRGAAPARRRRDRGRHGERRRGVPADVGARRGRARAALPLAHRPPARGRACATSSSACPPNRFLRRAGQPQQRDGRVWRWCLKKRSIDKASVTAVLTPRGRSALVATNARAQRAANIGVGDRPGASTRARRAGGARAVGPPAGGGRVFVYGARGRAASTFAGGRDPRCGQEHEDAAALPAAGRAPMRNAWLARRPSRWWRWPRRPPTRSRSRRRSSAPSTACRTSPRRTSRASPRASPTRSPRTTSARSPPST